MRFAEHIRSNVVGYVALFLALSAGAYAAGLDKNSVSSKHIKNDQVKSADVRNDDLNGGGLQNQDLAPASVGEEEVGPDTLTGAAIQEHTLEGVGSVGDFRVVAVVARRDAGMGLAQTNIGPYSFRIGCAADGDITIEALNSTGANDSAFTASTVSAGGTTYVSDDDFDTGNLFTIPAADDDAITNFVFAGGNAAVPGNAGVSASGTFMTQEYPAGGGLGAAVNRCVIDGTASVSDG